MSGEEHGVVVGHDESHDGGHDEEHGVDHDGEHGGGEGVLRTLLHPCKALLKNDHMFPNIH